MRKNPALLDAVLDQMSSSPQAAAVLAQDLLAIADGEPTSRVYSAKEQWALKMVTKQVSRQDLEAALSALDTGTAEDTSTPTTLA